MDDWKNRNICEPKIVIHRSFAGCFEADFEESQPLLLKTIFTEDKSFPIAAFLIEMLIQYPNQDVQLSRPLLEDISLY